MQYFKSYLQPISISFVTFQGNPGTAGTPGNQGLPCDVPRVSNSLQNTTKTIPWSTHTPWIVSFHADKP